MDINDLKYEEPSTEVMNERFSNSVSHLVAAFPIDLKHCIAAGCNIVVRIEYYHRIGSMGLSISAETENPVVVVQHDDCPVHSQMYIYESMPNGNLRATKFRWNRH